MTRLGKPGPQAALLFMVKNCISQDLIFKLNPLANQMFAFA